MYTCRKDRMKLLIFLKQFYVGELTDHLKKRETQTALQSKCNKLIQASEIAKL